jgi:hypothetical protein
MMDRILKEGVDADYDDVVEQMSIAQHYIGIDRALRSDRRTFVVPFRYGDQGWMDYQPMQPSYPLNVWNVTEAEQDWRRIELLKARSGYDWSKVVPFRDKGDMNHDEPWLLYLRGEKPGYPEEMLGAAYALVCHRLAQIEADDSDLKAGPYIHLWQQVQPVTTEALVQLTLGCPQVIYYGGMLNARVRYFDSKRRRPGLPDDVAALVDTIAPARVALTLVNLDPFQEREVVIQAGGLGEHRFLAASYDASQTPYPAPQGSYVAPQPVLDTQTIRVNDTHLRVLLPPATHIRLALTMDRYVNIPSYANPDWGTP